MDDDFFESIVNDMMNGDSMVEATRLEEVVRARDAELARLRADLADKIDTNGILVRSVIERAGERDFYKDELAKAQACADEMAALAWKWKYKADCLHETIRCLVVAFRIVWYCVVNEYPRALPTIKRLMAERKAKQAGE